MSRTDEYGIERARSDEPGFIEKYRQKWGWFDHLMLMQERYATMGGNQYSAGITYFSVLSMFPILMLLFAAAGFVLAARPEALADLQQLVTEHIDGDIGTQVNAVIDTAIHQRGAVAGIGALTALWSGLNWMNHLRYGVSKIWKYDPTGGNFVMNKLRDLLALLSLLVAMIIAFGVTAVGSSGLTDNLIAWAHLDDVPGIEWLTRLVAIAVGLLANYIVFFWLIVSLPRGVVPKKSAAQAAIIGAVAFEAFKQLGSMFFSSAVKNPAGATFGPIIGVMVLLYFIWRILLYCSAWAATTKQSLAEAQLPAPEPAVIQIRADVTPAPTKRVAGAAMGIGAAAGAVAALVGRKLSK
ncbi:inner membrane protein YhjD [Corynebacterium sp. 13CS0277]|uniref:YhjD/YihY/BrkB family envelope integrity protein n=1 Tax=Corynebacterium sp. 13CS0277 TaxID=2071994 RepID=UPI000D02B0FD|nr:YhjD/YihY/BrkB family envelope integrity protein [Corynebacterium sp. 13CS0277]PRQ11354.1 inner membrane protein YhjD [Corynebacterium sp. 13CS0277]